MRKNWQRAIADEEKAIRQKEILGSALRLFDQSRGAMPSVSEIAKESGLAKGTVYLYFKTKEEIFLALLGELYEGWIQVMRQGIQAAADSRSEKERLRTVLVSVTDYCKEHPSFLRLACISQSIIEQNLSLPAARKFKAGLALNVSALAQDLGSIFEGVSLDRRRKLLLRTYALIIGLWQICDVPPGLNALKKESDLAHLFPRFEDELEESVLGLWRGLLSH